MRAVLVVLASLLAAASAKAQCLGDFDSSGAVEINELITAVNNALNGCGNPAKRCTNSFTDDIMNSTKAFCAFRGPYNPSVCPTADMQVAFNGNGSLLVFLLTETNPMASIGAEVVSATTANVIAWSFDNFTTVHTLSGTARLENGGGTLVIDPTTAVFTIDHCEFALYTGAFETTIPRAAFQLASQTATDALDGFIEWAAQRQQRRQALPNLEHVR